MKPVSALKKDGNIVALFEERKDAYQLREEKQELEEGYFTVEKHILYRDIEDRERL
jgi:hypothetical protein